MIRSKVGRRIFTLFLLAAVLPICLISLISYNHVRQQISDGVKRQVHVESRALGLSVYDRMLALETTLEIIAASAHGDNEERIITHKDWAETMFRDVAIYPRGNKVRIFEGSAPQLPKFNRRQRKSLKDNNTVISIMMESGMPVLVMTRSLSPEDPERRLLIARPRSAYLWNFGVYRPVFACALTKKGQALACSSPLGESDLKTLTNAPESGEGYRSWRLAQTKYAVNSWDLFLGGHFSSDDISILLAMPFDDNFFEFNSFKSIFPKALLGTLLVVIALSISFIRKHMEPLEKLTQATHRLRDGNFNEHVKIQSGDEFETLANSFNEMSARIEDQFKTLNLMSSIDGLILSNMNADEIIKALIGYLHSLTGTEHIAIMVLNADKKQITGSVYFNEDPQYKIIRYEDVNLLEKELIELDSNSPYRLLDNPGDRSYLRAVIRRGGRYFIILPMREQKRHIGLICIGSGLPIEVSAEELETLLEIANRVAVALLNKKSEERLFYQAHYDALTELPNRYLLMDRLERDINRAKRTESALAVLFIDLDRFKSVNDSLGHRVGDELLVHMAKRLSSHVRGYDSLARFGGDEFVIIVSAETDVNNIATRASILSERILDSLSEPFDIDGRELFVEASIGITIYPRDGDIPDDLLKSADAAMYEAKANGRNTYSFYSRDINTTLLEKMEVAAHLRHALERDEFTLLYQPKISCRTQLVTGAEALIRWNNPILGQIPPDWFIPIAEEIGLIKDIGDWVLRMACSQLSKWRHLRTRDFHIAANLSAVQFRKPDFGDQLLRIIRESGVNPSELELEITERITIEDSEKSVEILSSLHKMGINISIDDFGIGYSSLSYIQQFNVDRLKVDKSFIQQAPDNENSVSIIRAILAMGHSLGLSLIAEGVETEEQYRFVVDAGFDELQGYYFSRPLDVASFEKFYLEH